MPCLCITIPTGLSSHSPDIELSKVYSFEKKQELFNILHSEHPDHYSRLYLVGFLKHAGYSMEEVCSIIDQDTSWGNYDALVTFSQVKSVFKTCSTTNSRNKGISSPSQGAWINRREWIKRYGKRMCTLHFVSCVECPDNMGIGQSCRGRV